MAGINPYLYPIVSVLITYHSEAAPFGEEEDVYR